MIIKKVVFSTTDMNVTSSFVKKEAYLDISATGQGVSTRTVEVIRKYPQCVIATNTSGQDIEVAFIGPNEEIDFNANPNNYFFLIKSSASINFQQFPKIFKVSVRKVSSNTTAEVRFDFYNHVGTVVTNSFNF